MKQLILQDERAMCADIIKKHFRGMADRGYGKIYPRAYFAGDSNFICDYLLRAVEANNTAYPLFEQVAYLTNGKEEAYRQQTLADTGVAAVEQPAKGPAVFFLFSACTEKAQQSLEQILAHMRAYPGSRCVITALLPEYPDYSEEITALSEREFSYYIETNCEKTPELEAYLALEARCRKAVAEEGLDLSLLRFTNVFAPDCAYMPGIDLAGIAAESYQYNRVTITDADLKRHFSITYIRNACYNVFLSLNMALKGHIYHADSETTTLEKLKKMIHLSDPAHLGLRTEITAGEETSYAVLSNLKLKKQGIKQFGLLQAGIRHLVSFVTGAEYDNSENVAFYCGKIKNIQALEVEILKEIDAICRENDIQYFLAGGTLLGAVRSGCSIPWDDDLDIGMLRDDFEKFRKVCKQKMKKDFLYSCPKTGNHYTIDKIRLDGTYFSTNFSKKNAYPDGIFVDILIYDKTSNIKFFQKLHGFLLTALTTLIYIRWYNVPRKNYHYTFSRLMLPLMRLVPWGVYHGLFDFIARFYRRKKNAKWLVDSVGKKVNDGPLPNEGLDEVVYVDFEGIKAPIPADPVPYLNYAYGPTYMTMPELSKRRCPHNFARIDLGRFVFGYEDAKEFRDVDVRGELFEKE